MADVKFQCIRVNGDFHVGDGRVILGPRKANPADPASEDLEGEVMEIPDDVAKLGEEKKMGKIVK